MNEVYNLIKEVRDWLEVATSFTLYNIEAPDNKTDEQIEMINKLDRAMEIIRGTLQTR